MVKEIDLIEGSWLKNLKIGNNEIWNIDKFKPMRQKPVPNPIPSDCRFREDLIWLYYKEEK